MRLRVREHVDAAAEIDAAVDWYADKRRLLAVELLDAVEASLAHVLAWPDSGRPYPGLEGRTPVPRTTRVRGFPSIVYLVDGDDLVLLAYHHDRQRPGHWRHRLDG